MTRETHERRPAVIPETTYRVECRNGPDRGDFPGLDLERAVERAEIERTKSRWATVTIRGDTSGGVVTAYHGAGPARAGAT